MDALDTYIEERNTEIQVAEEQIEEAATLQREAEERADALNDALDLAKLQALDDAQELSLLREQIAYLRRALRKHRDYREPVPDQMWVEAPNDVLSLVSNLIPGGQAHPASELVVFTGVLNDRALTELGRYDDSGTYARIFWDHVRVLYDYASLKRDGRFSGNMHQYLSKDDADGFKCPVKHHASTESDSVLNNAKWRKERNFPVPHEVDPSGKVDMLAHFRPSHHDGFAPRMHYFDDTAPGGTGKIYIGYLGRHLTNTKS